MINTFHRGNVTLTVDDPIGADNVTFTITRTAELTDDDVRRVNVELADYPAAQGARLVQSRSSGEWEVRSGVTVLATGSASPTAQLQWTARR